MQNRSYRGRLAPSPTGFLHPGHLATFLKAASRSRERQGTLLYRMEDLDLEIVVQANYALWSRMRNPTPRMDVNIGGDVLDQVGLGEVFDLRELEEVSRFGLRDVWTIHSGLDWGALDSLKLRAGFQYRPSPVPEQSGSTNLLDNQVFGSSAGIAWLIDRDGHGGPASIEVELAGLFMWLPRKTVSKVDIDPVGALSYGGFIAGGALSISHKYCVGGLSF